MALSVAQQLWATSSRGPQSDQAGVRQLLLRADRVGNTCLHITEVDRIQLQRCKFYVRPRQARIDLDRMRNALHQQGNELT